MVTYILDNILERPQAQKHGIVIVCDMQGVTSQNLNMKRLKGLVTLIRGTFPLRLNRVLILNTHPAVLATWNMFSQVLPKKMRNRYRFVKNMDEVYEVIDRDNLPVEYGGMRDHDQLAWVALQVEREEKGEAPSLNEC